MERRALVTETVLARAKLTEVLSGLGDNIVVELEGDTAQILAVDLDVELGYENCISISTSGSFRISARQPSDVVK